jgi:hypothetical protein
MREHEYQGSCRCGKTKVILASNLEPEDFEPRSDAESCHFCRAYDGVWISDPHGVLQINENNTTAVRTFASRQVKFHFCGACGELAYAIYLTASAKEVAVARAALFDVIVAAARTIRITNFEGEPPSAAGERRTNNWTPVAYYL